MLEITMIGVLVSNLLEDLQMQFQRENGIKNIWIHTKKINQTIKDIQCENQKHTKTPTNASMHIQEMLRMRN